MNIKSLPVHTRPREKMLAKGADNLKDKELLAILLRTGKKGRNAIELADYILRRYPLPALSELTLSELCSIESVDIGKACTLLASFEIAHRITSKKDAETLYIQSPEDALIHLHAIRRLKKEHFVALYLNARNQLIHQETISVGTLNASIVHPREVYEPAVRVCAGSVVIAHNHPSGDTTPSEQDIRITKQLREAGNILNIDIVDHLIVSERKYTSMKEEGFL